MKIKTILLYILAFILLVFGSEIVNLFVDPHSHMSQILDRYFINKSISLAKNGDFDESMQNLSIASKINIFGEYSDYFHLRPDKDISNINFSNNPVLKEQFVQYVANLSDADLKLPEDQGLGFVYYNLALIAWNNNNPNLTEELMRMAMYNNPQFASFHTELINVYFRIGEGVKVDEQLSYCSNFIEAKTLCGMYIDDSIRKNIPKEVGYMSSEVYRHYLKQ